MCGRQVKGEKMYNKARKGEHVDLPPRAVAINELTLTRNADNRWGLGAGGEMVWGWGLSSITEPRRLSSSFLPLNRNGCCMGGGVACIHMREWVHRNACVCVCVRLFLHMCAFSLTKKNKNMIKMKLERRSLLLYNSVMRYGQMQNKGNNVCFK